MIPWPTPNASRLPACLKHKPGRVRLRTGKGVKVGALRFAEHTLRYSSEIVTRRDLQIELAPIRSDIQIMKWMLGFSLALSVTILFKIFT